MPGHKEPVSDGAEVRSLAPGSDYDRTAPLLDSTWALRTKTRAPPDPSRANAHTNARCGSRRAIEGSARWRLLLLAEQERDPAHGSLPVVVRPSSGLLLGSCPAANKTLLALAQAKRRSDPAEIADDRKSSDSARDAVVGGPLGAGEQSRRSAVATSRDATRAGARSCFVLRRVRLRMSGIRRRPPSLPVVASLQKCDGRRELC
jgi:hypothetical protein